MKWELVAGCIVNLDQVVSIEPVDDETKVTKAFNEETQRVETKVEGTPYFIVFEKVNGHTLRLAYKSSHDRDMKFRNLAGALGAN